MSEENKVVVELKKLPSLAVLNRQVQDVVKSSSWWELYGIDWLHNAVAAIAVVCSLHLLRSDEWYLKAVAIFILGSCHGLLANKSGHLAVHSALAKSLSWNYFWSIFFLEFIGGFSASCAYDLHVVMHHPHTNIVGLGDSSTWKYPFVPRYLYMFVTPLLLPIIEPTVAVCQLWGNWPKLLHFVAAATAGILFQVQLLMRVSNLSIPEAIVCLFLIRAVLAIPYIHVNIFQHIGLPMYSQENRPVRLYQMATGVLNISRNLFLDITFGHGLISCHVEHHLFPKLSDNMCLKIKPLVSAYLRDHGLPYHEESYWNRLAMFLNQYEELMVKPTKITHFYGI